MSGTLRDDRPDETFRERIRLRLPGAQREMFDRVVAWENEMLDLLTETTSALDECRRSKEQLHRRAQKAESALAQATPEKFEQLDRALAEEKVEKHKYRSENAFMKSERKRLKTRIAELEAEVRHRLPSQEPLT